MGDTKTINITLSKEQHAFASKVKNGECWVDFLMRLFTEEDNRKNIDNRLDKIVEDID